MAFRQFAGTPFYFQVDGNKLVDRRSVAALEAIFHGQLQGARTVRIHRMQERVARQAIRPSGEVGARGIIRPTIAIDGVASGVTQVRVIKAELRVVEDIERFRAKLHLATLAYPEVLEQGHVKIQAARIIQEIPSSIAEREPARRNEFIRVQ